MAEIKSTLDLVMEKTKHLTMSSEERAGQQQKDFENKFMGLLQQYADNALSNDELLERMTALQKELEIDAPELVVSAVVQRIQPDLDNEHWLSLVGRLAPAGYTPLKEALENYKGKVTVLSQKSEQRLLENLTIEHGIQGSAVVPNVLAYAPHQEGLSVLKLEIQTRIDKVINGSEYN